VVVQATGAEWQLLEVSNIGRAAVPTQACVAYERQIGHPDPEADARRLEEMSRKAREAS